MKKLITLEQSIINLREESGLEEIKPNGIECPNCKEELYDNNSRPLGAINGWSPMVEAFCKKCDFKTDRIISYSHHKKITNSVF